MEVCAGVGVEGHGRALAGERQRIELRRSAALAVSVPRLCLRLSRVAPSSCGLRWTTPQRIVRCRFSAIPASRVRVERDSAIAISTAAVDADPRDHAAVQHAFELVAGLTAVCAARRFVDAAVVGYLEA